MTRTEALRTALGKSQPEFGAMIGLDQSSVSRLECGQKEGRQTRLLLDRLALDNGRPDLMASEIVGEAAE